jgi:hypothetical protein
VEAAVALSEHTHHRDPRFVGADQSPCSPTANSRNQVHDSRCTQEKHIHAEVGSRAELVPGELNAEGVGDAGDHIDMFAQLGDGRLPDGEGRLDLLVGDRVMECRGDPAVCGLDDESVDEHLAVVQLAIADATPDISPGGQKRDAKKQT